MERNNYDLIIKEKFSDKRPFIQCLVEFLDDANGREKVYYI